MAVAYYWLDGDVVGSRRMKVPARPAEISRWWKEATKALSQYLPSQTRYGDVKATPERITFWLNNEGMVIIDRVGRV